MKIAEEIAAVPGFRDVFLTAFSTCVNRGLEPDNLDLLRSHFRSVGRARPETIYRLAHREFVVKYGFPNMVKNYYLISELHHLGLYGQFKRIADIGSGPGTFALADMVWSRSHRGNPTRKRRLSSIDCSADLLGVLEKALPRLSGYADPSTEYTIDYQQFGTRRKAAPLDADLVVLSNSLSELLQDGRVCKQTLYEALKASGAVIAIVDYPYENSGHLIQAFCDVASRDYEAIGFYRWPRWNGALSEVDIGRLVNPSSSQDIPLLANTRFVRGILVPKGSSFRPCLTEEARIVTRYGQAWERHDITLLKKIFSERAVYYEKCEAAPLIGIHDIIAYWECNSIKQAKVSFSPRYVMGSGGSVMCIWEARFIRNDLRKAMRLEGRMLLEVSVDKIESLWEDFNKEFLPTSDVER